MSKSDPGFHTSHTDTSEYELFKLKEGRNVLFNDVLSTLYSRLYGVGHRLRTREVMREETRFCHSTSYTFRSAARDLLNPTHRKVLTNVLFQHLRNTGWNGK